MKPIHFGIFVSLSCCDLLAAGPDTYGYPPYLWQNTQTIETYSPPISGNIRSHAHGNRFADQLKSRLNSLFPSISVSRSIRRDAEVSQSAFANDPNIQSYEMLFLSGHGWKGGGGFVTYDHGTVNPYTRSYGTWTRWMYVDACQFLRNKNPYYYQPMFNGLHAIFGFESDMWYYIIPYDCMPWGCSHYRSEDMYNSFSARWVKTEYSQNMWDSWRYSVWETRYNQGGLGHAPATVYNLRWPWYGKTFIGHTEYIYNMFNGDVPMQSLYHEYVTYGTPTY